MLFSATLLQIVSLSLATEDVRHRTVVCSGSSLSISCPPSRSLHFLRANYGRFSVSVCPSLASPPASWSTRCLQPTSLRQLAALCAGRQSCHVKVDEDRFGDPCPGTPKYLQLLYTCREQEQEQEASSLTPPWMMAMDQLAPSSTSSTARTAGEVRNRFFDFMERVEREEEVEERSRVNTVIQVMEEEEELAVPFLGEEELEQQKKILLAVTLSLISIVFLISVFLSLSRCWRTQKTPPALYYEQTAYLEMPPSTNYTPFHRPLPLPIIKPLQISKSDSEHTCKSESHQICPTLMSSNMSAVSSEGLQEYDYIEIPHRKLSHI